jgi:hypothetical protein
MEFFANHGVEDRFAYLPLDYFTRALAFVHGAALGRVRLGTAPTHPLYAI